MRAVGTAILVASVVVLAGCGGSHERRDAVNQYFDRVDAAQQPVKIESGSIQRAFSHFSTVHNTKSETRALVRAQAVLEGVHVKVQRLEPPTDARVVHADIVRLYAMQSQVAGDLVAMTRFVPRYAAALAPLKPAHTALAHDLTGAKGWQKIAHAFEQYRLSLVAVLTQLDRLSAPSILRPGFAVERAALKRSASLCMSIEDALANQDAKKTAARITALANLDTEKSVAHARRDEIAAAKAYNARLAAIASLTRKIGKERDRLVGELG